MTDLKADNDQSSSQRALAVGHQCLASPSAPYRAAVVLSCCLLYFNCSKSLWQLYYSILWEPNCYYLCPSDFLRKQEIRSVVASLVLAASPFVLGLITFLLPAVHSNPLWTKRTKPFYEHSCWGIGLHIPELFCLCDMTYHSFRHEMLSCLVSVTLGPLGPLLPFPGHFSLLPMFSVSSVTSSWY